jgi:hypothetical protein
MQPSKKLSDFHKCFILESLEKWDDLDVDSKMFYLQAITYRILRSEQRGSSFRTLIGDLGLYPEAMMISELMTIHNSLFDTYTRQKQAKLVALPDNQGTTQLAISEGTAE